MSLTKSDVQKVAKLANLPLTSKQEEKYTSQLSNILEYIEQLEKVDTKDIDPTFNTSGQSNITAKDEVGTCLPQEGALQNASSKNEHFFATKGVFDNE